MLVVVAISVVLFTIGRQRITGEVEIGKWVLIGLVVVGFVVSCFI